MTVWKNQSFVENKMEIIVGFNKFIPNNYLVGCVAVVIGQIMKYHACPESCSLIMGKTENIKTKKHRQSSDYQCFLPVGVTGFEPATTRPPDFDIYRIIIIDYQLFL